MNSRDSIYFAIDCAVEDALKKWNRHCTPRTSRHGAASLKFSHLLHFTDRPSFLTIFRLEKLHF